MKEKRNCGNNMNYPIYQQPMMVPPMGYPIYQGGFQPNMMGMGTMQNITGINSGVTANTYEQQINNLVLESGGDSNLEVVQARGKFNTLNDRLNINDDINKLNISKTKLVQNVKLQHCIKNDGTVTPVSPSYALTYYDVTNLEYIYIEGNLNVPNGAYSDYLFKDVNGNVLEHQGKKNSNLSNIFKVVTSAIP